VIRYGRCSIGVNGRADGDELEHCRNYVDIVIFCEECRFGRVEPDGVELLRESRRAMERMWDELDPEIVESLT